MSLPYPPVTDSLPNPRRNERYFRSSEPCRSWVRFLLGSEFCFRCPPKLLILPATDEYFRPSRKKVNKREVIETKKKNCYLADHQGRRPYRVVDTQKIKKRIATPTSYWLIVFFFLLFLCVHAFVLPSWRYWVLGTLELGGVGYRKWVKKWRLARIPSCRFFFQNRECIKRSNEKKKSGKIIFCLADLTRPPAISSILFARKSKTYNDQFFFKTPQISVLGSPYHGDNPKPRRKT